MLDFTEASLKKVLTRYNVALEKAMTPEDAAEELYPKDKLIYPIAKAIFELSLIHISEPTRPY